MPAVDASKALPYLTSVRGMVIRARQYASNQHLIFNQTDEYSQQIQRSLFGVRRIAERIAPDLVGDISPSGPPGSEDEWNDVLNVLNQLIGAIEDSDGIDEMLRPVGPALSASGLHAWVWSASASLFEDGHYRAAVQKTATSVEVALQVKLGRHDISGTPLMRQAFTLEPPREGAPRLRFTGLISDSETYTRTHEGAMQFAAGCIMAIRNPATHDPAELEEQVALERLAALSVLARMIDEAEVVVADPT